MKIRRIILIAVAAALCSSCGDKQALNPGKCVGEIYVTAAPGSRSVLVSLDGLWRVSSCSDWISTDVNGRNGEGAFTFRYGSNESDILVSNPVRRGAIVIKSLVTMVPDTLYVIQQGVPDGNEYQSVSKDSYIEFLEGSYTSLSVLYANLQGVSDSDADNWTARIGADVNCIIKDGGLSISRKDGQALDGEETIASPAALVAKTEGVNFVLSDFGYTPDNAAGYYESIAALLTQSYDKPDADELWLVGGSFYYLSVMEAGYASAPQWYPQNPSDDAFAADRYALSSNLTDCVWMYERDFTPTWSVDGKSWRADYLYASAKVWTAMTTVSVLDIGLSGATHKAILVKIKF